MIVAVIDIGKTNAKVALVDLATLSEIALRRIANAPVRQAPYPHHDVEALWTFILNSLTDLNRERRIDAISITTHGATGVLVDAAGELALPVLDYEFDGPDQLAAGYDAARPPFAETGTPRLPIGLNLGAQFFWQQKQFPAEFARAATMLMYPQYWALRLTGVAANEVTSLGCHTDLWNPWTSDYSSLVDRMGWRRLMAPVRPARDRLGPILPAIAQRTGLAPQTPVFCGLHDSNASLLPHLLSDAPPFSVVSTGTWVVSMAVGGRKVELDPARDTLVNVNALGDPVPSARFMGGREFSLLTEGQPQEWSEVDVDAVLARQVQLLPSTQQGSGPFPHRAAQWHNADDLSSGQRFAAVSFYLALMTATCLELIGGDGPTTVEGPFARNPLFNRMLAAATARSVIASEASTGTSIGAALLASDGIETASKGEQTEPPAEPVWGDYAEAWRLAVRT
ncbi:MULTISPECIES: FGGY-family carbohydrate kinase [unclassified Mesorhizobium]|uniref:FGGY-family carbohydrate kinase n=1 Tax=unclassified Mesorhizobium TaxID=325217 RepID=UPI000F750229|nr:MULTISPECIES: FGGY-family carbohydrate kinase [unclassified Mesorhizobium]AZO05376.1 carbohydrate kinase [Mesorhizobium sp. M2A.F.Ca.ET.043.02.1.1]RUW37449.1 carbohydrate kinase [Mesorhizobium sp. M2A.F.Ca.ET.015.02.1.1]RUW76888.1 carbohydrate kinase [Mesorhizobium sp. M2A.F.Ca.ET.067.02.1.1]RVC92780.1 carbohydrate kinase [Mesorhizobium sp. M2A.F.Ca.ET.017.03.2.1]RVC99233.1 carbohydrate kinase [Mesorhizobium sp. M2A.F.Ca.ET.029.05.1.1]